MEKMIDNGEVRRGDENVLDLIVVNLNISKATE